jgi:hypothetical protein
VQFKGTTFATNQETAETKKFFKHSTSSPEEKNICQEILKGAAPDCGPKF